MMKPEISPERRQQRRKRRRRRRLARPPVPSPSWVDDDTNPALYYQHSTIHVPQKDRATRKRIESIDEQTPTTQPSLVDTTIDEDDVNDDDDSLLGLSTAQDGACAASNTVETPTRRVQATVSVTNTVATPNRRVHDTATVSVASNTVATPTRRIPDTATASVTSNTVATPTRRVPDTATVDESFSDRYSVTVSHHQKLISIKAPSECDSKRRQQHRQALAQLRKSRRQHDRGGFSSCSSTSVSESETVSHYTFWGELKTVASDVSFFFYSLKESLTEPQYAVCCARPTYVSYHRKRKPRKRRYS